MRIDAVSIFPEYLAALDLSLVGKARKGGLLDLRVHDLRDWTHDRHRTVDDTPYGGGAGMVMRPEPWGEAIDAIVPAGPSGLPRLIVPTPAGRPFDQTVAIELAAEPWLVFACGRYEGIDARVAEEAATRLRVDEISIGDYVLNGGEVAVLVIVEAVARLLPGVIGNPESLTEESHTAGLLEYPVYTKPATWRGRDVPAVLTSGDHGAIARWRQEESVRRTAERRPDLLARWAAGGSEQAREGVRFEPAAEQDAGELVSLRHVARTGSAGTVVGEAGTVGGEAGTVGGEAGSVGGDAGTVGRDAGTGGGEAGSVGGEIADLAGRIGRGGVWKAMAGGRIIAAAAAAAVRAEQPVLSVEWVVVAPDRQDEERSVAAFLLDSVERAAGPEIRTFEAVARTEAELRLFRGAGYRPEPGAADPVRLSKRRRRRR